MIKEKRVSTSLSMLAAVSATDVFPRQDKACGNRRSASELRIHISQVNVHIRVDVRTASPRHFERLLGDPGTLVANQVGV